MSLPPYHLPPQSPFATPLGHQVIEAQAALEPIRPCDIWPENRPDHCDLPREYAHAADVETMMSCGCVWNHCLVAYRLLVDTSESFACEVHGPDVYPMIVRPLHSSRLV